VTLTGGSIPASGHCTVTAAVTAPVAGRLRLPVVHGAMLVQEGAATTAGIATLTATGAVTAAVTVQCRWPESSLRKGHRRGALMAETVPAQVVLPLPYTVMPEGRPSTSGR